MADTLIQRDIQIVHIESTSEGLEVHSSDRILLVRAKEELSVFTTYSATITSPLQCDNYSMTLCSVTKTPLHLQCSHLGACTTRRTALRKPPILGLGQPESQGHQAQTRGRIWRTYCGLVPGVWRGCGEGVVLQRISRAQGSFRVCRISFPPPHDPPPTPT